MFDNSTLKARSADGGDHSAENVGGDGVIPLCTGGECQWQMIQAAEIAFKIQIGIGKAAIDGAIGRQMLQTRIVSQA